MLEVVSGGRPIAAAIRTLRRRLAGLPIRDVSISWHGGGGVRGDIVWLRDEHLWWRHDPSPARRRHNLMFGHAPSPPTRSESPTCEINLPMSGADRRLAGALVRDAGGAVYLAHSGKIGGVRSGRHRDALRTVLAGGNWQPVRWPDGRAGDLLVIGPLEGPRLARQIGRFVRAVHACKRQGLDDMTPGTAGPGGDGADAVAAGGAAPAADTASQAALCDRGLVLDALAEELARRGLAGTADAGDPLFATRAGAARVIELETDAAMTVLERTIGRLLLRSAAAGETARAILVVPDTPDLASLAGLSRHGVTLVRYRWRGMRPVFAGLDAALG